MFNFIKNISPVEIAVIAVILFVIFGRRIFTGIAKTSGETFKQIKGIKKSITDAIDDNPSS